MPAMTMVRKAACIVFALHASAALAQTLSLTVPYRGASSMQAAATTIEFDPASDPAGATISFSRTSSPAAGPAVMTVPTGAACVDVPSCTAFPGAAFDDDVSVVREIGSNRVQLQIAYSASFSGTFCAYSGAASPKTYTVTLSGFSFTGSGHGYRITSYMAAPESCDVLYTRVPSPRPSLSGSLTKLGRLPLNVVLALDKSPSMAWTIPGSADIRWDALKGAAQLFTNVWDVIGAPPSPATISSEGHADDRLGLLFFGGTTVDQLMDGVTFFKSRGTSSAPWSAAVAGMLAPAPGFISATSIGAGVVDARSKLNGVKLVEGDTATVLFTDGEQNQPPCILPQGQAPTPTSVPYPGLPGQTYVDQCFVSGNYTTDPLVISGTLLTKNILPRGPIFTIALGEATGAHSAILLDRIAAETAGAPKQALSSAALTQAFIDTLVDNLKGGTVSTLDRTAGTLPSGTTSSAPFPVAIDPSVTRAVFVLSWRGQAREIGIEIRKPDGAVVAPPLQESGPGSRVVAVDLPASGPAGTWQARVVRPAGAGAEGALAYQLTAYAVESRLGARISQPLRLGTGQPVKIVAEVGWGDDGLDNLPPGAIMATIERPGENLGNLLSAPLTGDPAPKQLDASPLMVKFHRLAATPGFLDRISPHPLPDRIPLVGVGNGRYEGTFDGTRVGGQYRIRIDFDWTDPRTDRIRRIHIAERQVPVAPTANGTVVEVQREPRSSTAVILVTPRDGFGNMAGPGLEGLFNVSGQRATVGRPADFELSGTYRIEVSGLAPDDDPPIRISYGGETLHDGPLTHGIGAAGNRMAVWLALGSTFPHGSFRNAHDGGFAGNIGFEYGLNANAAIEATLGYHEFKGTNGAPEIDVTQYGVGAKWYFAMPWRPFLTAGIGGYSFDPGSSRFGGWVGAGVQVPIDARWSIEGRYNYHMVSGNSPNSRYSTLQLGVRYGF